MLIQSWADRSYLYTQLSRAKGGIVAIDTETTGLHLYEGDVCRGVSLAWRERDTDEMRSAYIPVTHPEHECWLDQEFANHLGEYTLVYHHAAFDWASLNTVVKFDPRRHPFYDTLVGAWLENENIPSGLKDQGALWLGADSKDEQKALRKLFRQGRTWATVTAEEIEAYARKDTELTLALWERQRANGVGAAALDRELAFQHIIYDMNRTGVVVNEAALLDQDRKSVV